MAYISNAFWHILSFFMAFSMLSVIIEFPYKTIYLQISINSLYLNFYNKQIKMRLNITL